MPSIFQDAMSAAHPSSLSKRLVFSYILDWIVIIVIAGVGAGVSYAEPYMRPFSLLDLSLSYPFVQDSISITTVGVACMLAPAVLIALIVLLFVPGPRFMRETSRSMIMRIKFWEFEKGIAGLALALAVSFFLTSGLKNLFGKPRPNMIARCQPDLSDIASHVVGGYGQEISERWVLVSASICTQSDIEVLRDGFRSFPSGHSSFSWAGMLYLSLFFCSKFAIAIPFTVERSAHQVSGLSPNDDNNSNDQSPLPTHNNNLSTQYAPNTSTSSHSTTPHHNKERRASPHPYPTTPSLDEPLRNQAATPPNHLLVIALIPICVAFYICSTRFPEFYHFGFDIISGSLIGIISAWGAFRWYHAPIRSGQGWAWGARSRSRAFGIGVGTRNYVGDEGWETGRRRRGVDVEAGRENRRD